MSQSGSEFVPGTVVGWIKHKRLLKQVHGLLIVSRNEVEDSQTHQQFRSHRPNRPRLFESLYQDFVDCSHFLKCKIVCVESVLIHKLVPSDLGIFSLLAYSEVLLAYSEVLLEIHHGCNFIKHICAADSKLEQRFRALTATDFECLHQSWDGLVILI